MKRKLLIASIVGIVALAVFPSVVGNPYYIHLLETIMIYAIVLFGLDIVVGYTGQVSLGHAGLFGIGAYTAGVLVTKLGAPFLVALIASIGVTAVFGALLALPASRAGLLLRKDSGFRAADAVRAAHPQGRGEAERRHRPHGPSLSKQLLAAGGNRLHQ
jgi:ABC-type branched-subunit amino acid transport system permease subunit